MREFLRVWAENAHSAYSKVQFVSYVWYFREYDRFFKNAMVDEPGLSRLKGKIPKYWGKRVGQ